MSKQYSRVIHWFRRDLRLTDNSALHAAAAESLTDGAVLGRIAALGQQVVGGPVETFGRHIRQEVAQWRQMVRAARISAD